MVLGDITNDLREAKYHVSLSLPPRYCPAIRRGHRLVDQASRAEFSAKRRAGDTNLDLWLDGSIYPENPTTQKPPPFRDLLGFLCFVGDGLQGFFGYTNALRSSDVRRCNELTSTVGSLSIQCLETSSQLHLERTSFRHQLSTLEARIYESNVANEGHLARLNAEIFVHIEEKLGHIKEFSAEVTALQASHIMEVELIQSVHKMEMRDLKLELLTMKNDGSLSQLRYDRLCGSKRPNRKKLDFSELAKQGGRAKQVRTQFRYVRYIRNDCLWWMEVFFTNLSYLISALYFY